MEKTPLNKSVEMMKQEREKWDILGMVIDDLRSDADKIESLRDKLKKTELTGEEQDLIIGAIWAYYSRK